jgi:hypothetical protein
MVKTITKPRFEEVVVLTTMNLPDEGLAFNAQKVGPMSFVGLRNANYGPGFKMPTIAELIPLIYSSLENKNYDSAKNVIETLKYEGITGNTGILDTPKGMYVQDNPKLKNRRILMNARTLERKLGKYEEEGVIFSDDKSIRFVPCGFRKEYRWGDLAENSGIIALTSSGENAEKLVKASEHYKHNIFNPYFWALNRLEEPRPKVAILYSGGVGHGLKVVPDNSSEDIKRLVSFGVLDK